jgi:UDP-2,3-diacylglucosamine hydrolase
VRAILFSDAHLPLEEGSDLVSLCSWLDSADVDQVCILGDLFDVCWSFGDWLPPSWEGLFRSFRGLQRRGVELVFLGGNRDFAMGGLLESRLGVGLHGPHERDFDGLRIFLAHGDEADRSIGYRSLRRLLRSSVFDRLVRSLGPEAGLRLLRRLGEGSREAMESGGPIRRWQSAWAQARLDSGADAVAMGHSHDLGEEVLRGGTLYRLGDWQSQRSFLLVESGMASLQAL